MDELIFLALIIGLMIIIAPILAIVSLNRSNANRHYLLRMSQRIEALEQQIKQLSSSPSSQTPVTSVPIQQPQVEESDRSAAIDSVIDEQDKVSQQTPAESYSDEQPAMLAGTEFKALPTAKSQPATAPQSAKKQELPGIISSTIKWFIEGNPLAKVGILLLFFGLVYLMKYSIERNIFSVELRLASAALIGAGLLAVGWRLRHKQPTYALILQGGAIGALYLTVFGAFRFYELLPHILAFGLMLIICAASVALAVLQRALSLAMLASIGGYLSPILLSTGSNDHAGLFSYYLMLSIGILVISIWQPWRILNLLGFAFTFGIATLWGFNSYQPEDYLTCQLFLIANILIFGVLSVGLSLRQQIKGKEIVDGVLVFGPPLLGFGMQYAITQQWEFGPAFSAIGFGVVYLTLAYGALRRYPGLNVRFAFSGLALGLAFITLAIPLALSPQWTAIAWSLEGLGIVWVGLNQQQKRMAWSGCAVLVLALCSLLQSLDDYYFIGYAPVMLIAIVTACYLAAAALWFRHQPENSFWLLISRLFIIAGVLLWLHWISRFSLLAFYDYIEPHLPSLLFDLLPISLMCLSVILWRAIGKRLDWPDMLKTAWLLWPFLLLVSLNYYSFAPYHAADQAAQWLGCWIIAAATGYRLLKNQANSFKNTKTEKGLHLFIYWGIVIAGVNFAAALAKKAGVSWWGMNEWIDGAFNAFIAAVILVTARLFKQNKRWIASHRPLYLAVALLPIAIMSLFYSLQLNKMDGVCVGWPYIPLVNPLDLSIAFTLLTLIYWLRLNCYYNPQTKQIVYTILALLCFYWLNGIILRTLAFYNEISWNINSLWKSRTVQTTLALFWTFIALVCMICSNKYRHRKTWLLGAGLLGVTIIKLFLVDSAKGGGLARAVAFIGVALLILVVGYFAPLPPKQERPAYREDNYGKTDEN